MACRYTILRYFNVAGADPNGRTGQRHRGATHLIKVACEVALGRRAVLQVFGDDYPTPRRHLRARLHPRHRSRRRAHRRADEARPAGEARVFNCGYGTGHSVREVVAMFGEVMGKPLPTQMRPRRAGDPPSLVCDSGKLQQEFGWRPEIGSLRTIVETALRWEGRNRT